MPRLDNILPNTKLPTDRPIVATIGNFDGVHVGHHALIHAARQLPTPATTHPTTLTTHTDNFVLALAFYPHPATLLNPAATPRELTDWPDRERRLIEAGADLALPLTPTRELLALDPDAFIERIVRTYQLAGIVEGHDFRFGRARAGTPERLIQLAQQHAIAAQVLDPVDVQLVDQTVVRASSTMVRWLMERGRVDDAARVLGRPPELQGTVVRGDRLGRTIGFPTANLHTNNPLPADAIYAAIAITPDAKRHPAAVHIGPRDTLNDPTPRCEAHLLNWTGPARTATDPEYDWPLRLQLIAHLREPARFESLESMVEQIHRDVRRTAMLIAQRDPALTIAPTTTPHPSPAQRVSSPPHHHSTATTKA